MPPKDSHIGGFVFVGGSMEMWLDYRMWMTLWIKELLVGRARLEEMDY